MGNCCMVRIFRLTLLILGGAITAFAQIGTTIPLDRKVDWQNVGYHRSPDNVIPGGSFQKVLVPKPTNNASENYRNIMDAIAKASELSSPNRRVMVQLQSGKYIINHPIRLNAQNDYIIIRGVGADSTIIFYEGSKSTGSTIIQIRGISLKSTINLLSYNAKTNTITLAENSLEISQGDYLDIRVPNGSWHSSLHHLRWNPKDYFGQVVKVSKKVSDREIELEDDFNLVWSIAARESITPYVRKFIPAEEIGIENLKIEPDTVNDGWGYNIFLEYAVNCWLRGIESANAVSSHVQISKSSAIEIRECYFHGAQNYGAGGHGYGVNVADRSTNCLIEDNIFQHLRHSMIVQMGASRNVFGYNYSREQHDEIGDVLADLSIHGHYAFANLFEGNWLDRIEADSFWGSNGPYNTFVRNYVQYQTMKVHNSDYFNFLANEAKLILLNSHNALDKYSELHYHTHWKPSQREISHLADISYYHNSRPQFIDSSFTWPPLGPPSISNGSQTTQNIPARQRFCSKFPEACSSSWLTLANQTSDLAVLRSQGKNNPNRINRIFGFSSQGSTFVYITDISYGGYNFHGLVSGDYNGDGIDDIAFYRAYGDIDRTLNRVLIFKFNGVKFSYMTNISYGHKNFAGITSGDYNGDGIDDIAVYVVNDYNHDPLNKVIVFKSNCHKFLHMTAFPFARYIIGDVTSGDYNGDGFEDIAFCATHGKAGTTQNDIFVFKSDGKKFSYMANFSHGQYDFKGITSGDYNGDGYDDIALYHEYTSNPFSGEIFVFLSNGNGFRYITNLIFKKFKIGGITSGDYNGDGYDDIAVYGGSDASQVSNKVIVFKSDASTFSYLTDFSYGTYDFQGITSGRYFNR